MSAKDYSLGYLYLILKLFAETAAKPNEIHDLKWKQVDREQLQIQFLKSEKCQARALKISEELSLILEKRKKSVGPVFLT